jgi:hypothetical protein
MSAKRFTPLAWLMAHVARLRQPQLFLLAGGVFLADLLIPDVIPFVDEILLGIVTAILGSWRRKKDAGAD